MHIRMRRSHKRIIEQAKERRGTTMTMVVVRIAFEEMKPADRRIPNPTLWEWIMREGFRLEGIAENMRSSPQYDQVKPNGFSSRRIRLSKQRERREDLWEKAQRQKRNQRVGVRLKPGRLEWLEQRARQKGTSRSALLRSHSLRGIKKRDRMAQTEQDLFEWEKKARALRKKAKNGLPEEVFRDQLKKFSEEIMG